MRSSNYYQLLDLKTREIFVLRAVTALLGRDDSCDLPLMDTSDVSRRHARLSVTRGLLHVQDLDSANGTKVNGRRVREICQLQSGDVLSCGRAAFLVVEPGESADITIQQNRLPEQESSFVEDQGQQHMTSLVSDFQLPAGWSAHEKFADAQDEQIARAENRLSKYLMRENIGTATHVAALVALGDEETPDPQLLPRVSPLSWGLGRASGCDVLLTNLTVSSQHARIARNLRQWSVEDLDSTNGTRINGQSIAKRSRIHCGDVLALGMVQLLFKSIKNS
ncbi:MAG: pSer/pThr/pTyr-binding forkhead associated (FHA) protein [Halieaceae bacterium]|jgi:pSer/pThr/pTyr-binding forkhead associated (FHA) protein